MHYSEIANSLPMQRFAAHVRNGWKWNPETLQALKDGETTAAKLAAAYAEVGETEGLSVEDATAVIEYALSSPEY